jgi:hypothetical protein
LGLSRLGDTAPGRVGVFAGLSANVAGVREQLGSEPFLAADLPVVLAPDQPSV